MKLTKISCSIYTNMASRDDNNIATCILRGNHHLYVAGKNWVFQVNFWSTLKLKSAARSMKFIHFTTLVVVLAVVVYFNGGAPINVNKLCHKFFCKVAIFLGMRSFIRILPR